MLLLLDTNVEVKSDPLSPAVESDYNVANRFLRLAAEGGHRLFVHPSSLLDFARDEDLVRRRLRERTFQRWPRLESPPRLASDRRALLGPGPEYGSNDDVDQDMLAAVVHDPVDRLVTQDAEEALDLLIALNAGSGRSSSRQHGCDLSASAGATAAGAVVRPRRRHGCDYRGGAGGPFGPRATARWLVLGPRRRFLTCRAPGAGGLAWRTVPSGEAVRPTPTGGPSG